MSRFSLQSLPSLSVSICTSRLPKNEMSWSDYSITPTRAPTLEAAKAEFEAIWRKWLEWAELSGPKSKGTLGKVRVSHSH
jgi:hypothetical protein